MTREPTLSATTEVHTPMQSLSVIGIEQTPDVLRVASAGETIDRPPNEIPLPSGLLRQLDKGFICLDRWVNRWVAESANPLLHTGAIAVTTLLIATVTGIVLLIWYKPSVHLAYESVEAMSSAPLGAGLIRSLHRYSSDAAVLFGLIHAARIFFKRRFEGARWLAWVTGAVMMGLLWFIGWTGYWLVWDLRAQSVAVGTAKMLDTLPIIADPLGRSFVTDEGVNSLLFFVVFFIHMIIPLAMAVVMWLHITRLARPRFLTQRPMTIWVSAMLLLLCIVYPARNEAPAMMTAIPTGITMDWWYLFPMPLIDRLSGGASWAVLFFVGIGSLTVPWWLAKRSQAPATVVSSRCNECKKCYVDCPYEAIEMIPRNDGIERYLTQASVIPSKCVACGICAGSCDTMGIGVDWLSTLEQRRLIGDWLKQAEEEGETVHVAFFCAGSAGAELTVDPITGHCDELPGYRVLRVPCSGWTHPLMIERALRQGAAGVLVTSCGPDQCAFREGAEWERQRLEGVREPALRADKIEEGKVQLIGIDRTQSAELIRVASRFRSGEGAPREGSRSALQNLAAASLLAICCAGLTGMVSDFRYTGPGLEGSEFVVSLKHPGAISEDCRDLSEEELEATPIHMRKARVCERKRSSVRLRIVVDGATALQATIAPSGIWNDGNSAALKRVPVEPGDHLVSVAIGETADEDEWSFSEERTITFTDDARRVVVFDRVAGFTWH